MYALGITADLVDINDRMSGTHNGYSKSPHVAIGDTVPQYSTLEQQLDLGMTGLSLHPGRDDAIGNGGNAQMSRTSRDTGDIFARASSIWAKNEAPNGGWDRASHFASRPQSPQRSMLLTVPPDIGAPPKTAPLPAYAPFNPVITPPAPAVALPLKSPSTLKSPSPPQAPSNKGKENMVEAQAHHYLEQLQSILGPLVAQAEAVAQLKAEVTMWKNSAEAAVQEVVRLEGEASSQAGFSYPKVCPLYHVRCSARLTKMYRLPLTTVSLRSCLTATR